MEVGLCRFGFVTRLEWSDVGFIVERIPGRFRSGKRTSDLAPNATLESSVIPCSFRKFLFGVNRMFRVDDILVAPPGGSPEGRHPDNRKSFPQSGSETWFSGPTFTA
jgi:hypothetical protein